MKMLILPSFDFLFNWFVFLHQLHHIRLDYTDLRILFSAIADAVIHSNGDD